MDKQKGAGKKNKLFFTTKTPFFRARMVFFFFFFSVDAESFIIIFINVTFEIWKQLVYLEAIKMCDAGTMKTTACFGQGLFYIYIYIFFIKVNL